MSDKQKNSPRHPDPSSSPHPDPSSSRHPGEGQDPSLKITLSLIVKNEEKHLENCLNSFEGLYNILQITDTGSTDKTKEIAKNFGAKIFDFKWIDDFAAARNFGLEKVQTEWVMTVDADDIIEPDDKTNLKKAFQKAKHSSDIIILPYVYAGTKQNPQIINYQPRLWKTNLKLKFDRPIHEHLDYERLKLKVTNLDYPIIHQKKDPYIFSLERNLKLLNSQIENGKDDQFTHYYLGNEYFNKRDYPSSEKHYLKFLEMNDVDNKINICTALTNLGLIQMQKGGIEKARQFFEKAMQANPELIDAYLYLAEIEMNLFSVQKAIKLLNIARNIKAPPKNFHQGNLSLYEGMADKLMQLAINKLR